MRGGGDPGDFEFRYALPSQFDALEAEGWEVCASAGHHCSDVGGKIVLVAFMRRLINHQQPKQSLRPGIVNC